MGRGRGSEWFLISLVNHLSEENGVNLIQPFLNEINGTSIAPLSYKVVQQLN